MPHKRNEGEFGRPTYDQAAKIIARFGGETTLAKLIGVSRITVYRWQYRRPVGTDGLIPGPQIEKIKAVARLQGILLRADDWVPQKNRWDGERPARFTNPTKTAIKDRKPTLQDLLS